MSIDTERKSAIDEQQQFAAHLEKASQIVRSWPAWKRTVLGGTVSSTIKLDEPSPIGTRHSGSRDASRRH